MADRSFGGIADRSFGAVMVPSVVRGAVAGWP
jgi:hypothetical protein